MDSVCSSRAKLQLLRDLSSVCDGLSHVLCRRSQVRAAWASDAKSLQQIPRDAFASAIVTFGVRDDTICLVFDGKEPEPAAESPLLPVPLAAVRQVECTSTHGAGFHSETILWVTVASSGSEPRRCCLAFADGDAARACNLVLQHVSRAAQPGAAGDRAVAMTVLEALRTSLVNATAEAAQTLADAEAADQPPAAAARTPPPRNGETPRTTPQRGSEAEEGAAAPLPPGRAERQAAAGKALEGADAVLAGELMWKVPFSGRGKAKQRWVWVRDPALGSPFQLCWIAPPAVQGGRAGAAAAALAADAERVLSAGWEAAALQPEARDAVLRHVRDAISAAKPSTLSLEEVADVRAGHSTSVFWKLSKAEKRALDPSRCLSLVTPSRTVDFAAPSQEVRDRWVASLQAMVKTTTGGRLLPSPQSAAAVPGPGAAAEQASEGSPPAAAVRPDAGPARGRPGAGGHHGLVPAFLCSPTRGGCGAIVPPGKFCGSCGRKFTLRGRESGSEGSDAGAPDQGAGGGDGSDRDAADRLLVPPWMLSPGTQVPRVVMVHRGAGPGGARSKRGSDASAAGRLKAAGRKDQRRRTPRRSASSSTLHVQGWSGGGPAAAAGGASPAPEHLLLEGDEPGDAAAATGEASSSASEGGSEEAEAEMDAGPQRREDPRRAPGFKSMDDFAHVDEASELQRAHRLLPRHIMLAENPVMSAPLGPRAAAGGHGRAAPSAAVTGHPALAGGDEAEAQVPGGAAAATAAAAAASPGTPWRRKGGPAPKAAAATSWAGFLFKRRTVNNGVQRCSSCRSTHRVCNCTKCAECGQLLRALGIHRHHCRDCGTPLCDDCWTIEREDGRNRVCRRARRCEVRRQKYGIDAVPTPPDVAKAAKAKAAARAEAEARAQARADANADADAEAAAASAAARAHADADADANNGKPPAAAGAARASPSPSTDGARARGPSLADLRNQAEGVQSSRRDLTRATRALQRELKRKQRSGDERAVQAISVRLDRLLEEFAIDAAAQCAARTAGGAPLGGPAEDMDGGVERISADLRLGDEGDDDVVDDDDDDAMSTVTAATHVLQHDRALAQEIAALLGENADDARNTARDMARARKKQPHRGGRDGRWGHDAAAQRHPAPAAAREKAGRHPFAAPGPPRAAPRAALSGPGLPDRGSVSFHPRLAPTAAAQQGAHPWANLGTARAPAWFNGMPGSASLDGGSPLAGGGAAPAMQGPLAQWRVDPDPAGPPDPGGDRRDRALDPHKQAEARRRGDDILAGLAAALEEEQT